MKKFDNARIAGMTEELRGEDLEVISGQNIAGGNLSHIIAQAINNARAQAQKNRAAMDAKANQARKK